MQTPSNVFITVLQCEYCLLHISTSSYSAVSHKTVIHNEQIQQTPQKKSAARSFVLGDFRFTALGTLSRDVSGDGLRIVRSG